MVRFLSWYHDVWGGGTVLFFLSLFFFRSILTLKRWWTVPQYRLSMDVLFDIKGLWAPKSVLDAFVDEVC